MPSQSAASRTSITIDCLSNSTIAKSAYVVYYSGNSTKSKKSSTSLPITISNLTPGIKYVVTVEAENSAGYRENSTTVVMRTKAPGSFILLLTANLQNVSM